MAKVYVFLANGFEEVEALIPIDVLRRGGVDVVTVSIMGNSKTVTAAHNVQIVADAVMAECNFCDADLLFLPGGMPGASNLYEHEGVRQAVIGQVQAGKKIAAICAAPIILAGLGLLEGKKATCHPSAEAGMKGAKLTHMPVTVAGNITTGQALGAAIPFALELAKQLESDEAAEKVRKAICW